MWVEGECSSGSSRAGSVAGIHNYNYIPCHSAKDRYFNQVGRTSNTHRKTVLAQRVGTYICRSPAATLVLAVLLCDSKVTYNAKIELH